MNNYSLAVEIDKLTNNIAEKDGGRSFKTIVSKASSKDVEMILKKNGWKFNWKSELKMKDRKVFKLTIVDNTDIQGLVRLSYMGDHIYLHLIESAPQNFGRNKLYEGVAGNLIAFCCKESWDNSHDGIIAFKAKTDLIPHYEDTLGAVYIGDQKMIIFPEKALFLINKYFKH